MIFYNTYYVILSLPLCFSKLLSRYLYLILYYKFNITLGMYFYRYSFNNDHPNLLRVPLYIFIMYIIYKLTMDKM